MKPYSKDLRVRVLAAVDRGVPREEVAKTFSVSMPTIKRWLRRRRETGDVRPKAIPG
jgi:transposase